MNWFKKRKQAKAKEEALEIASRAADSANAAMANWEATSLQTRRTMMADFFDERITDTSANEELEFGEWAEIEALACLKNWIERRDEVVQEISAHIDSDTWEILKIVGVAEEFLAKLYERFDEVGHELADDLDRAIEQEQVRRGSQGQ